MQHIPCPLILTGFLALLVHAGPRHLAAADVDRITVGNGDGLCPFEEAAALLVGGDLFVQEDLRQIVLIGSGRRQLQVGALAIDGQRVLVGITGLAGGELGQQLAALDPQRRKGGIGVAERTAQIGAQTLAGVHDADHVTVAQRAVLHGELLEAEVGEPVVQRAHPAGLVAAVHLGQSLDRGDIAILRTGLGEAVLLQRRHDAVHHGAVGVQVDPLIHQLAVPRCAVLHGVGGVLHDDLHLAVVGGLTHGHHGGLIRLVHLGGGSGGLNGLHARVIGGLYAVAGQTVLHGVQAGDGGVLRSLRVAADRCPCDGYGHVIEARGHLQERVGDALVALEATTAFVEAGVIEAGAQLGGGGFQTADRDALDGVLGAVDHIGHVAQHTGIVVIIYVRHIHGGAGVGNAPALAGNNAGAVRLALGQRRVAAQEVRGVVGIDAGIDVPRQGRGLGDLGVGSAVSGTLGSAESKQLCHLVAADAGTRVIIVIVILTGVVLQIGDHVRQRRLIGCGHAAVVLPERQLAGRGGRQFCVGDGVVLLLLTARQLAPLIGRHSLIAGLELRHRIGSRGVQLAGIVGQLCQQTAELLQIGLVAVIGTALQFSDGLDGLLLGVARLAGGLCRVDGRHGGVVGVLYLLPVLSGEHALGVLLVVVHGVQLLAQLLLHGVQIAGSGDVYQHGGAHGVAGLVGVRAERIQQDVALVVQGQGGLAALVRHGVGVHAHIAGGGGLGALRRVAAVDRRARHGAGACGTVEGQRCFRGDADGERLPRLHLNGSGDGAVPEIVGNIHQESRIGARAAGILHLLGIDPHDGQLVLVVEPDGLERAGAAACGIAQVVIATGTAEITVYHFPVQEYQCLGGDISILQQAPAVQQVVGAGVGVQRQGRGIGVGVVEIRKLTRVPVMNVVGIQHRYVHFDLCRVGGGQPVDGLSQLAQSGRQRIPLVLAQIVQRRLVRQLHCRGSRLTQCLDALGGIARQGVRLVLLRQIPDGLDFQLCDGLTGSTALFIQRLAGRLQLRRHRLDALLRGGLVVVGGVALRVKHGGHQGLGLVAGGLIGRPGLSGVVLHSEALLQFLVQHCGIGTVSGDQVGNSDRQLLCRRVNTFLIRRSKCCLCY